MQDLSLHILDVAENAVRAEAKNVTIKIAENEQNDRLVLSIKDDGVGMDKETIKFKYNVDTWIKQIRSEFSQILDTSLIVDEAVDNIQHNYELIHQLKDEIVNLKREIELIKVLQLIVLKQNGKSQG